MAEPSLPEESIFLEALEITSTEDRAAYLERACGDNAQLRTDVEALLTSHGKSGDILDLPDHSGDTIDQSSAEQPGTRIGPYKLVEQIGKGGMGVVYRAEQHEPVRRDVALKIIKPGMDTRDVIARFEVERQALAMMNHPNIAKVLAAGTTESERPYFVMELVQGVPITQFADKNQLTTRQRLQLFGAVCEAVQHAHQKGIIHRDIKPSNVLVTFDERLPTPKIIDFGIAKAVKGELTTAAVTTGAGQIMGTPRYMSPEQAGLDSSDVDTRTDIYSLGVLLYELLTGATPFNEERLREANYYELRRLIREEEPPRPSAMINTLGEMATTVSAARKTAPDRLSRLLRGELDWIVFKALEKDRDRRYATASFLASDILKYLNDETVEACPPSKAYRFRKFARRNKVVLTSALLVATSLVGGAGIATWQSVRAMRESVRASQESENATRERNRVAQEKNNTEIARAEAVELATLGLKVLDDIYLNVLGDRLARQQAVTAEQRQLLQTGLDYYERFVKRSRDPADSDWVIANAHRQVGLIYGQLGDRQKEEDAYRKAIALYEQIAEQSPDDPDGAFRSALVLGSLLENQAAVGNAEAASDSGDRAIQILKRLHDNYPDHSDYGMALAGMHNRTAWALASILPPKEVERHHRDAIRLFDQLAKESPDAQLRGELPYDDPLDGAAHSRLHLAQVIHNSDRSGELRLAAFRHFQDKVAASPSSQWHRAQLAEVSLTLRGKNVRRGVELLEQLHSEFPSVPLHKYRLAYACERLGNSLSTMDFQVRRPRHDQTLTDLEVRHTNTLEQGVNEAERYLSRAVQLSTELVRDFPNTSDYQSCLATALGGLMQLPRSSRRRNEARRLIELAIERQTEAVRANPDHRQYRDYLADHFGSLAIVLEELGESERVDAAHAKRIELLRQLKTEDSQSYEKPFLQSRRDYADWLTRHGDIEDAEEIYRDLIAICSSRNQARQSGDGERQVMEVEWSLFRSTPHQESVTDFETSDSVSSFSALYPRSPTRTEQVPFYFCPGGAIENSPALQCWENEYSSLVPVGTAETQRREFNRPYGTQWNDGRSVPSDKSLGYCREVPPGQNLLSSRTTQPEELGNGARNCKNETADGEPQPRSGDPSYKNMADADLDPEMLSFVGSLFHGLANVHVARNEFEQAKKNLLQAVERQETALDAQQDPKFQDLLCRHLCRLSTIHSRLDHPQDAQPPAKKQLNSIANSPEVPTKQSITI